MPCLAHMLMTRSKCLKPDCLRTRGFMSSECRRDVGPTSATRSDPYLQNDGSWKQCGCNLGQGSWRTWHRHLGRNIPGTTIILGYNTRWQLDRLLYQRKDRTSPDQWNRRGLHESEIHNQDNLVIGLLIFNRFKARIATRDEVLHADNSVNESFFSVCRYDTHFIHPPRPAPRRTVSWPSSFTILVPETFRSDIQRKQKTRFESKLKQLKQLSESEVSPYYGTHGETSDLQN